MSLSFDYRRTEVKIKRLEEKLKKEEDPIKRELLQIDIFITTINNLQNELLTKIKIKDMKYYNEIITEFIFIIASNIILKYDDIIYNINYIANLKNNSYPSISNKIIFIHKDILEKYLK